MVLEIAILVADRTTVKTAKDIRDEMKNTPKHKPQIVQSAYLEVINTALSAIHRELNITIPIITEIEHW